VGTILLNGLFHGVSTRLVSDLNVNVAGIKAIFWYKENTAFTVLYLFFPSVFFVQYILLKKMDSDLFILFFVLSITISSGVLFYQAYADNTFLMNSRWLQFNIQRFGGLSTDPNAYAMTAFFLLSLSISRLFTESGKMIKGFYLIIVFILLVGILFSGSRTTLGGVFLLIISVPIILGFSYSQWTMNRRLILIIFPFLLIILSYFMLPFFINQYESMDMGIATKRVISTWNKFSKEGLDGVLSAEKIRIRLFMTSWALFLKAPLAGWGPGGFYREYPNEYYIESGNIQHSFDSGLNHYLMIGSDLGIPSLFWNLLLIFVPLIIAVLAYRKLSDPKQRFIILILLVTNVLFLIMINTIPPLYFPGLIWVWTAQLVYLVIIGEKNDIFFRVTSKNWWNIIYFLVILTFLLVLFGSYQTTFGKEGYKARHDADWWPVQLTRNCYRLERWERIDVRWCKKDAFLQLPVNEHQPDKISLTFAVFHPDVQSKPVGVKYGGISGPVHEIVVKDKKWKTVDISITDDYILEFKSPLNRTEKYIVLSFDVSRTWVPKEWGVSEDQRELGLLIMANLDYILSK
jgi:hypothetical protein